MRCYAVLYLVQLDNFYIEFPRFCTRYYGPHTRSCLNTIWNTAGCVDEGYDNPNNLTIGRMKGLMHFNME